ncbi:MAG: DNA-binding response regulator [Candidatus Viridilinea halotolerans]|uniref:DNA-binding response regulator n=1 Tax=Candidatus Viridilinea halotolerans TaxID=2491704 RepID=A0A426TV46_9CHLR|nr:MAG: DNA-binding response regulator [Candidatus Viridilinea halotolerans]
MQAPPSAFCSPGAMRRRSMIWMKNDGVGEPGSPTPSSNGKPTMAPAHAQILVVDDETVVRRVLGDALAQTGYRVRTAASGEEALAAMAALPADLVLLDLQLGDSNGVDVMQIMRSRWPQTQIIILTAHGSMGSAIAAVRHEAADYLLKPIGVDALRQRVGEVLTRHRASRERQTLIRTMYQQLQSLVEEDAPEASPAEAPPTHRDALTLVAGPLVVDSGRYAVHMRGQPIEVTPTEFAILQILARNPDSAVSCVQIVQTFQAGVESEDEARQIVRPHIVRLRRKIEADPTHPHYIQSVRGIGYRWGGEA